MIALLLLVVLVSTLLFWNFVWKRRGLPPGPIPLPLIGNTHTLARCPSAHAPYAKWAREYGPVYTFWLGEAPVVAVCDFGLMRELFVRNGDAYAGRHFVSDIFAVSQATNGVHGVVSTQGEKWKVTRRFSLHSLRNLGMGRAALENKFLQDIGRMIGDLSTQIQSNASNIICPETFLERLIGSTINQVLFGHPFSDEQMPEFHALKREMDWQAKWLDTWRGRSLCGWPWLRHLPLFDSSFAEMDASLGHILAYCDKQIASRMAERERGKRAAEPMDLLDAFLDQMEQEQQTKLSDDNGHTNYFDMDNLRNVCADLFFAGQETTVNTMNFLVLYMLLDQRAQARLHAELAQFEATRAANGGDPATEITAADRPMLPYVNAVINETQRMCNLVPLNLTHKTMCDVDILDGAYHLSTGTIIVPQISCLFSDEKLFPEPHLFKPERFLEENGQLKRCEELVPFGLGKRSCLGESLARMELFLFTANFFRQFKVLPIDALNVPSAQHQKANVVRPAPYECRIELNADAKNGATKLVE